MTVITREWGRYAPAEVSVTFTDRLARHDTAKAGCVLLHGRGGTGDSMAGYATPAWNLINELTDRGIVCLSIDAGGPMAWSNSRALQAVTRAVEYLGRSQQVEGPVALVGFSMGALTALNWAADHREATSCVAGLFPLVDLVDLYRRDVHGYSAEIRRAHGGRRAIRARNPVRRVGELAGVPIHLWWSTDDPVIAPSTVAEFAQQAGAATTCLGPCGHSQVGFAADEVAAWVAGQGAVPR